MLCFNGQPFSFGEEGEGVIWGRRRRGQSSLSPQVAALGYKLAMPRQLRIQYEGAIYYLMSRGDRREAVFRNDADRKLFLCGWCGKNSRK